MGSITADQKNTLVVYILSDAQYKAWRAGKTCNPDNAQGSVWQAGSAGYGNQLTTANVDWTPLVTGTYWILAQTYSSADVVLTVNLNSQFGQIRTVMLYSTLFSTTVYALTQTLSSVMAQQLPQSQPNNGLSGMALPLGIIVIVVLVLIGYLAVRRRKK